MKTLISAGKGGTGKSMIVAHLLNRHILTGDFGRILVIDADPHESLTRILTSFYDYERATTLGELRHSHLESLRRGTNIEISRSELADVLVSEAIAEMPDGSHLLIMGRNDQPGCQCVVNALMFRALDALREQYDWIVVDNEAGIEHIGRHAWPVDILLLVSTLRTLELDVTQRILERAQEIEREIRYTLLALNRTRETTWRDSLIPFPFDASVLLPFSERLERDEQPDDEWLHSLDQLWNVIQRVL